MNAEMADVSQCIYDGILLKWQRFDSDLIEEIQDLYSEDAYCDCTLFADNTSRDCHRLVLSSYSPFLQRLIQENTSDRPVLILDGVTKDELNCLVEFMYTGSMSISTNQLDSFLETCKHLDIRALKDVTTALEEPENSLEYLEVSDEMIEAHENDNSSSTVYMTSGNSEWLEELTDIDSNTYDGVSNEHKDIQMYAITANHDDADDDMPVVSLLDPQVQVGEIPNQQQNRKLSQPSEKRFQCPRCNSKYSHKRTLLHHIHWVCNQPASYKCQFCPYSGKRKFQLKSHVKHVHKMFISL